VKIYGKDFALLMFAGIKTFFLPSGTTLVTMRPDSFDEYWGNNSIVPAAKGDVAGRH